MMNPFKEPATLACMTEFYRKFYDDERPRHFILGINPGRFGGGVTGVPFTDTKRLLSGCGIRFDGPETHEPSSAFVYEMIGAFGGPEAFYSKFYINSICPLGFTSLRENGREVNYNYYDSRELQESVKSFCVQNIREQIGFGLLTDTGFCFGTGKNEKFLRALNEEHRFFKEIAALEHPRFIMQYKAKTKQHYLDKYLAAFGAV